jgi:hypothetical protein
MSETVHLSNKSSGLLQASRNSAGANMSQYTYSMSKPSVNKFIDKWQKTTFQGADWGREVTASIPPYGLVKSMMVKFNISFTPQSVVSSTNANVGTCCNRTRARLKVSTLKSSNGNVTKKDARTASAFA